jgi:alkylation response protein AidB-like acyl-CoA dehydrogenase
MEHDAQLYYRRVTAWSLQAGDPELALDSAAACVWGNASFALPEAGDCSVDFNYGEAAERMATRASAFCARYDTPELHRFQFESNDCFLPDIFREMAKEGLLYPDQSADYGGGGLDARGMSAVAEAMGEAGWYIGIPATGQIVGTTIFQFATEAARQEVLAPYLRGEVWFSLGYTEPSGGSDIFAAKTTATRDGDDWVIKGQKMFTSEGHIADYCLMIARTGPDKYRGITLFIVPVRQPGYTVSEIKTIGGQRTNITFYDGLRVPDRYRLGEVNGGLKVMAAALVVEQSGGYSYTIELKYLLQQGLAWARRAGPDGRRPLDRPRVARLLAQIMARLQVQDALSRRSVWAGTAGCYEKWFGPMAKLFGSEAWLWSGTELMKAAAPDSLLRDFDPLGIIEKKTRRAIPGTIYAGTSEIQRSIIAETALGMPRSR